MHIISARIYVSTRTRALTADEAETKRIAYALKDVNSPACVFAQAGREIASLITGPCTLVPVPNRNGRTDANFQLCLAIADHLRELSLVGEQIRRTGFDFDIRPHLRTREMDIDRFADDLVHGNRRFDERVSFRKSQKLSGQVLRAENRILGVANERAAS